MNLWITYLHLIYLVYLKHGSVVQIDLKIYSQSIAANLCQQLKFLNMAELCRE